MSSAFDPPPEQKPNNPFANTPTQQPQNLSQNLAHQARSKQLNVARWILIIVGLIYAAVHIIEIMNVDNVLKGLNVPAAEVERIKQMVVVIDTVYAAIGIAFVIMGIAIYAFPVPITIVSLILYIGSIALVAAFNPLFAIQGFIWKILIIVGLSKSIGAAIEYEKERKRQAGVI